MTKYKLSDSCFQQLPHSKTGHATDFHVPVFKEVLSIVKPKNILEIGFNAGHSASIFLKYSPASLFSVDINDNQEAREVLFLRYPKKFKFIQMDSKNLLEKKEELHSTFDLAYIDGDHKGEAAHRDVCNCAKLYIPFLLIDDYYAQVKTVIEKFLNGKEFNYHIYKKFQAGPEEKSSLALLYKV